MQLNKKLKKEDLALDVTVQAHNWGSNVDAFHPPVDIVLGADVVYLEETFPALLSSLSALTKCGRSTVLLALTIRYRRDLVFLEQFESEFQCARADYDNETSVLLLHARKHCVGSEKAVNSCSKAIRHVRDKLQ